MKKTAFSPVLILACFLTQWVIAQDRVYDLDKTFSVKALKEDLAIMQQHLETVHPGLYTYTSKEAMDQRFAELDAQIMQPLKELEFYQLVGLLLKDLGDAHSDIEPSEAFYDALNNHFLLFPLSVKWIDDALYITRNYSTVEDINLGDKILSINGVQAKEVFHRVRDYVKRDGYNLTGPTQFLCGNFSRFRNYYATIYDMPAAFELKLESAEGAVFSKSIPAATYPEIKERYWAYQAAIGGTKEGEVPPQLSLDIQGKVSIMTIKSFHPQYIKRGGQQFKKFYKQAFSAIKKAEVEHLILDLRANVGGSSETIIDLFSYLYDQPFLFYKELSLNTTNIPDHHYYMEAKSIPALEKAATKRTRKVGKRYVMIDGEGTSISKPKPHPFKGDLYVLINGRSHSATGDFCGVLKQHNRATFIGEETGGNPYQNTAGLAFTLVLPNSQLNVIIPTTLFRINIDLKNDGRGMIPDYEVSPGIQDILKNRDVVKEFALELIRKK